MAMFGLSTRSTVTTTGAAAYELRSAATNSPKLMELIISMGAATASVYGIGRPAAIGVTPTTPVTVLAQEQASLPTGLSTTAVAWGTPPTVPTQFDKRASIAGVIGNGLAFVWPRGYGIPVSSSIVVWNLTTNSAVIDISVTVDE